MAFDNAGRIEAQGIRRAYLEVLYSKTQCFHDLLIADKRQNLRRHLRTSKPFAEEITRLRSIIESSGVKHQDLQFKIAGLARVEHMVSLRKGSSQGQDRNKRSEASTS